MGRQLVHLHTHSEMSVFDGCGKQDAFIERAKEIGNPAIAFTEHGSMRGVYKLDENCKNIEGIKPLYGVELYLCEDMASRGLAPEDKERVTANVKGVRERNEAVYQEEVRQGLRGRFHITVLAKNNIGLKNLYRLTSLGWLKGYYKRPRVDLKTLGEYREGLIVLSGCMSGVLNHKILQNDMKGAIEMAEQMVDWFGEDFYLEVMAHPFADQIKCNKALIKLSQYTGIKLVATQDAHWINPDDAEAQECLLCIQTDDVLSNPDRFKFEHPTFWLKTREELEETFRIDHGYFPNHLVKASLDETLAIAEKCTAKLEIDRFKAMVPAIPIPAEFGGDEYKYLYHLCYTGWHTRKVEERAKLAAKKHRKRHDEMLQDYQKRLVRELKQIRAQNVGRYFLVIWDMYNWARSQNIFVGPGRGSAGGCLVSFLLGITDIDPLEHGLIFERFLAPGRIDLPDIDCDFEARRRDEVIAFLKGRYGHENTAQIATLGTLKGKACLKDVSRVLQIPSDEVNELTKSIVERSSGDERASQCLEDSFKEFKVCQDFDKKYPKVLQLAKKLEGQARSLGMHAAGVVVSPVPLIDVVPLETRSKSKYKQGADDASVVTAVDMYGAAGFGLMKIDVLGLRNLDCIDDCLEMIQKRHGKKVDWDWIPMTGDEAKPVYENFTKGDFTGIFQYDTPGSEKICSEVDFTDFEDVVALVALNRPGTARSGLATEYIKRKRDPKARKSIHPVVDAICADTLGVIVYQEHVLKIFTEVAGFSPATADSLRKKIAKKWGDEAIGKERANFVNGAVKRGFPPALAEDLINKITFFGSYGFNKSHATAYGLIAYRQMYLKTYYPAEFMWSLLANEPDSMEVTRLVKRCKEMGLEIQSPDVNSSGFRWAINAKGAIVGSLYDLKNVGEGAVKSIEANQPYKSFSDLAARVNRRAVNRRVIQSLLRSGALREIVPNQKYLDEHMEDIWDLVGKGKFDEVDARLEASRSEPDWTTDEAQMIAAEVNPLSFGKHPVEPFQDFLFSRLRVPWMGMDSEEIWEKDHAFFYGQITEVKYNRVGDFHTGAPPDEQEKIRMKWGSRYANLNVEDMSGKQHRVKVDVDIFDDFRHIVDKGQGTIVAFHASINRKFKSIRAHYLVDIGELRKKVATLDALNTPEAPITEADVAATLNPYERTLTEWHPVYTYSKKDIESICRRTMSGFEFTVTGLVTHLNRKLDKKQNEMAFFGILGASGYLDVLCFASSWGAYADKLAPGKIVRITLKRDKSTNILNDGSEVNLVVLAD